MSAWRNSQESGHSAAKEAIRNRTFSGNKVKSAGKLLPTLGIRTRAGESHWAGTDDIYTTMLLQGKRISGKNY